MVLLLAKPRVGLQCKPLTGQDFVNKWFQEQTNRIRPLRSFRWTQRGKVGWLVLKGMEVYLLVEAPKCFWLVVSRGSWRFMDLGFVDFEGVSAEKFWP